MAYAASLKGGRAVTYRGSASIPYLDLFTGGTNTKGAWAELVTAVPFQCEMVSVNFGGSSSQGHYLTDIGIGAAGSEVVIIPDLLMSTLNDFGANNRQYTFPYKVRAGARLAARQQNNVGTARSLRLAVTLHGRAFGAGLLGTVGRVRAYGVQSSGASWGTEITPGATANVKGSWIQMVASTTCPIRRILLSAIALNGPAFCSHRFDIGVGAAGAEVVVAADLPMHAADLGRGEGPMVWADVNLPAGVRLSLRSACENTNANRTFNLILYGIG